jgi:peptidoglycan/LPS O-acetylase OafA/YrhL
MADTKTSANRLHSLDALRGIAALIIALWHYAKPESGFAESMDAPIRVTAFGRSFSIGALLNAFNVNVLGVQLFFVLSGFVMYVAYRERISDGRVNIMDYAVQRFSRLYPVGWITLIAQTAINLSGGVTVTVYDFLSSAMIMNSASLGRGLGAQIVVSSWSLAAEMWAYALFFLLCTYSKKRILPFSIPVFISIFVLNLNIKEPPFFSPQFFRVFVGFFMGCFTAVLWKKFDKNKTGIAAGTLVSAIFTLYCVYLLAFPDGKQINIFGGMPQRVIVFSVVLFPALLIAVLNVGWVKRFLSLKVFRWLGDISFGVYLWHLPIFNLYKVLWKREIISAIPSSKWTLAGLIIIIIGISTASYYLFEKPVQIIIRTKYEGRKSRKLSTGGGRIRPINAVCGTVS